MIQKTKNPLVSMPVLALRGMVLFPKMVLHFDVGRELSIKALNEAMENNRIVFLAAQKDILIDNPEASDIFDVGVVGEIKQIIKAKGHLRVLVEGLYRANLVEMTQSESYFEGFVEEYPMNTDEEYKPVIFSALQRSLKDLFEEYAFQTPRMARELVFGVMTSDDPVFLTEYIASNTPLHFDQKQAILEESDVVKRLQLLIQMLEQEIEILSLEQEINEKVRSQIDTNQREFYLREQMRVIASELGDDESPEDEFYDYHQRIERLNLADDLMEQLHKEASKLKRMPPSSQEANVIRTWLDIVLDLPWDIYTKDNIHIENAKKQLDKDHYGMDKVKERILEMLAVRQLAPDQKGQIICLVGPPGVGKTSIARSVAKAMNRNYVRMSLGGVRDESDIRGHRKTYVGAMPGRIINAINQAKSSNPLLLLDEVDKLGSDFRGDPSAALLEVLDSEQNFAFRDHYIELPFDLSQALFLATANDLNTIPQPLLDRMEIIELGSYTREEKYQIAKKYLVPKQLEKHGISKKQLKFNQSGLYTLIDFYTREAGVRTLERQIASICRKVAKQLVSKEYTTVSIGKKQIENYLGAHRFKDDDISKVNEIGVVNGLAWTSVGGTMLQVEVAVLEGTGKIVLTGSLGDVMKESAQAAVSYVRSCASDYNINPDFYKTKDIHIHVPEGAVPKDGPSAGVTMVTALVSALSEIPVRGDVAMTGEISLRGRVMAIGGLREKTMAAYRNGMKTVLIPESNLPDLQDVDPIVKENIVFVPAREVKTVLEHALLHDTKKTTSNINKKIKSHLSLESMNPKDSEKELQH